MKQLLTITVMLLFFMSSMAQGKIVIAIDAGHGGKDSGAIGANHLYEKDITLSIAKQLANLLRKDGRFKPVLTRASDCFVLVSQRSEIARKHKAHLLISIHADAAPVRSAIGASLWILSTQRADTELGRWLEQGEKQSELLGGAGHALSRKSRNIFLSQAVLDLQFSNSQRVSYGLAKAILKELAKVTQLHKSRPEHASLGVLRSPDIPSVLVEVGFISNAHEASLLRQNLYQNKLAISIYKGIRNYIRYNRNIGR